MIKDDPADLTKFVPEGIAGYGFQAEEPDGSVITRAPRLESTGGCLYLPGGVKFVDLVLACHILGIRQQDRDFVVYSRDATEPVRENYLRQIRIVPDFALKFLFEKEWTPPGPPERLKPVVDALWEFVERERKEQTGIRGVMGGDGHFAYESLAFGLAVENAYYRVVRCWSRAWLVTK